MFDSQGWARAISHHIRRSPFILELDDWVSSGGPEPGDYLRLGTCLRAITRHAEEGPEGPALLEAARAVLAPTLLKATVQGFAHLRPHGYDGDFELIERLLSFHHSADPNLVRWDRYCHALPSVRALRARATHLRDLMLRLETSGDPSGTLHALHFRSGPAREFADYFIAHGGSTRFRCDCVDPDSNAVLHGRRIVARLTDRMSFHHGPLLRYRAAHAYHLIWASSLCETLDDRAFVAVVRRLLRFLEPGGRLVLCQLGAVPGELDDTDALLGVLGNWRLRRRDARALEDLAIEAGGYPDVVRVMHDPRHPNLFLHVQRPIGRLRRRCRKRVPLRLVAPEAAGFPSSPWVLPHIVLPPSAVPLFAANHIHDAA